MSDPSPVRIGTRASVLALAQAQLVRARLAQVAPDLAVAVTKITTTGDRVLDRPLADIGGKGLFIGELESALRAREVRLAVHSGKDIPSALPDDMRIVACLPRADTRDALIAHGGDTLASLKPGARVGTSSPRRACQLRSLRPDLDIRPVRGNVHTRLAKLNAGDFDALILAAAGLARLGLSAIATQLIDDDVMLPCAAQGAIAIEARADDEEMLALGAAIDDRDTSICVAAERGFLAAIGGGCDAPLAAHAVLTGDRVRLSAMIGSDTGESVHDSLLGAAADAEEIGRTLATTLLRTGGAALMDRTAASAARHPSV